MKRLLIALTLAMLPIGAMADNVTTYYTQLGTATSNALAVWTITVEDALEFIPEFKAAEDKKTSIKYNKREGKTIHQALEVQQMRQLRIAQSLRTVEANMAEDGTTLKVTGITIQPGHDFEAEAFETVFAEYADNGGIPTNGNYSNINEIRINGWDYFWGTTLNTQNTGWDDFWFQCQDPAKTEWDCVGTVAAGIGFAVGGAVVAVVAVATAVTVGVVVLPEIILFADVIGLITIA